jgi:hypothetical protein
MAGYLDKHKNQDGEYNGDSLTELGTKWMGRIRASEKRDERWLKDAKSAEIAFTSDTSADQGTIPEFNILHSNIATIVPAIFNSTPVPDVRERFAPPKPVEQPQPAPQPGAEGQPPAPQLPPPPSPVKAVADLIERAITVQLDDNALDAEVEDAAQDGFMAGRGLVRLKIDADVTTVDGEDGTTTETTVSNERVLYEAVSWRDYREGPGRRFEYLPWCAFRHFVTVDDNEKFDEKMVKSQRLKIDELPTDSDSEDSDVEVWEVWCRVTKTVKFVRASDGHILNIQEDPLKLKGFFPHAKPVQPIGVTGKRLPVTPYIIYRKQAEELDAITRRIKAITSGLKVRGVIVGDAESIKRVADAGDNELVPIQNVEGLAQTGGLDKAIVWWPVDKAIQVLRELYIARDQIKNLIYEVTGISDITRGVSDSSETLGAQQIKTQWGSLRIKKMQRLIERMVRDLLVMTAELLSTNFTLETLEEITGMEITPEMKVILEAGLKQYLIDVESDSTIRADLTRIKGEMAQFLEGTASFFATMAPAIQQNPQMAKPIVDLYSSFARQFNLGKQAEDAIEEMGHIASASATGQQPDPAAEAQKGEMQMKIQEMQGRAQIEAAKVQNDRAKLENDRAGIQMKAQTEQGRAQADAQVQAGRLQYDKARLKLDQEKLQLEREKVNADLQLRGREVFVTEADAGLKSDELFAQFAQQLAEIIFEGNRQLSEQIQAGTEAITSVMAAPKELIRDPEGRPIGVRIAANDA